MRNRHIFLILAVFTLYSCQVKKEQEKDSVNNEPTKNIKEPEFTASGKAFEDQFIDGQPIYTYLRQNSIDEAVQKYYHGDIDIKENEKTERLLESLINANDQLIPFYYRCFVEICKDADTTMSTFLGKHAIKLVEHHTEYVMNKLNNGYPDYYTGLISNYIYQRKDWESEVNELSVRLHQNLEHAPLKLRKELDLFIVGIKNDIEHITNQE